MNPNITKIIDQYIAGELSAEDQNAFELKLNANAELKEEVEIQQLVIEGAKRAGQRMQIKKVSKLYHLNKLLKWGTISMSAFIIALFASNAFFISSETPQSSEKSKIIYAQSNKSKQLVNLEENNYPINGNIEKRGFPVSFDSENVIESSIPTGFLVPKVSYLINPTRDTVLKIGKEGTSLFIPKYAFVDQKGKTVKSLVEIKYQEYKNSAEIAFSGIPMVYKKGNTDYMFNSSGMFSLFGYSQGKPVEISRNKTMKIDYKLVRKNAETNFYVLDEDSSNWKFVAKLKKEVIESCPAIKANPVDVAANHAELIADTIEGVPVWLDNNNNVVAEEELRKRHGFRLFKEKRIFGRGNNNVEVGWEQFGEQDNEDGTGVRNNKKGTLLASGADAGHTYPDIVKGLNVGRFGVYNCDQIYRLGNRITVIATYQDENGNRITDGKVLSMIDMDYTGAFSFDPKSFTCNAKADNVLLLFTRSGKMYLLDKGKFQALNISGGKNTLKLREVTDEIKSTKDLEAHLEL